jgi:hypothetical protein
MILPRHPLDPSETHSIRVSNEHLPTSFVRDNSIKTVSIDTSTSDAAEQEPLTQTSTAHNREPKDPPLISNIKYAHRDLERGDVVVDDRSLSEAIFPMLPGSFERQVGNRRGWIIVVIVVLIVVIMVGILAGIRLGKFIDSKKESSLY